MKSANKPEYISPHKWRKIEEQRIRDLLAKATPETEEYEILEARLQFYEEWNAKDRMKKRQWIAAAITGFGTLLSIVLPALLENIVAKKPRGGIDNGNAEPQLYPTSSEICPACGWPLYECCGPDRFECTNPNCPSVSYRVGGEIVAADDTVRLLELRGLSFPTCENCGRSLIDGTLTVPWENGSSRAYRTCQCGYKNYQEGFGEDD